jgi:epoxyqueuosine reductase QueG
MALHPEFGLWSAYRAVLYTECNLPASRLQPVESACVDCAAPCVSACPAGALSQQEMPDARECLGYRITADSVCADRCVARLACPVAEAHHYPLAQIQHHYADPLTTWRRYFAE